MAFKSRKGSSCSTTNHQNLQFLKSSKVETSNSHKQEQAQIQPSGVDLAFLWLVMCSQIDFSVGIQLIFLMINEIFYLLIPAESLNSYHSKITFFHGITSNKVQETLLNSPSIQAR